MEEHKVIANVALYLIKEQGAEISEISIQKKQYDAYISNFLVNNGVTRNVVKNISFKRKEEDIIAHFRFSTGRKQKYLEIEAKGGNVYYNFYTCLGQFMCLKKSPSTYYWFAYALPYSWRRQIRKMLRDSDGNIKPIINDIILKYTKRGQGLWFYFVKNDGSVVKETWKHTLA